MNDTDALFKEISLILKRMQGTEKNIELRVDKLERELLPLIGRLYNLLPSVSDVARVGKEIINQDPNDNIGSETGIETTKEYK